MTRGRVHDGLRAGLAATLLMTGVALVWAPRLPGQAALLMRWLGEHPPWLLLALAAHLGYGALAGGLYFGGARRVTVGGAALFGLTLWGVAVAVYAPLVGLGFVGCRAPELALLALPAHALYGLALAAFAPRGEILQPA
jgi:hypothetical protein